MDNKRVASPAQIALRLTVICVAAALLLTGVQLLTAPRIEAQQQARITASVQALFPTADSVTLLSESSDVYRAECGGVLLGYCVLASANGYGGALQLMVGFTDAQQICGVQVISHAETEGIGSRVMEASYLSQYVGKGGALTLAQIDGCSGATRSVKGVLAAVNAAAQTLSEVLS